MARKYAEIEILSEGVFRTKAQRETNREIAQGYGLSKTVNKNIISR